MLPPISYRFFLIICAAIFLFASPVHSQAPLHEVRLYHDEAFLEEQERFYPFDTIYVVVDLMDMEPGNHQVDIDWIQPNGKLARSTSYMFNLDEIVEKYRVFFWLKLHAKGPLGQLFSGEEYVSSVFGRWTVQLTCDGEPLSVAAFVVSDEDPYLEDSL